MSLLVKFVSRMDFVRHIVGMKLVSRICVALCLFGFIAWGGSKPNTDEGQNNNSSEMMYASRNPSFSTNTISFTEEELTTRMVFLESNSNSSFVPFDEYQSVVNEKWTMTGAAYDYMYIKPEYWSFPFGEETKNSVFVSTTGNISFGRPVSRTGCFSNDYAVISPFRAVQGVLPEYKWDLLGTNTQSRFWYTETDYESLILTWENFLLGRMTNSLVSYQAEFFYNGEIEFRYDFSRLNENLTNVVVGFQQGISSNYFTNFSFNTTGVSVKRLPPSLANNHDEDGDGLTDAEEIFVYKTNPSLNDTDLDGKDDAAELFEGSNPNNSDENSDGVRDFLPTDPNGLVVESYEDSIGAFVFGSNMPEGEQATLVINSTIIPITQSFQVVFLALEEGVLYDYKVYLPRNCLADFSFENTLEFVSPKMSRAFLMRNLDVEEKIMDRKNTILYTRNKTLGEEFAVVYSGKVSNTILALIHEADFNVAPYENPCVHNNQADILLRLKTEPEIFMNGAKVTTSNLTEIGDNTFVLSVSSPNIENEILGEIIYSFETSKSEVQLCARAHMCESGGLYCLGCGVFHNGECPIHIANCMVPFEADAECTCKPIFYELQLSDRNSNGVEDRYESTEDVEIYNIKKVQLIDNEDHCCCNSFSERTYIDIKKAEHIAITEEYPNAIEFYSQNPSSRNSYSELVYDVYEVGQEEPINTLTNKILIAGVDLLFDYDDNGVIDENDKGMQNGFTDQGYYFYSTDKQRMVQLRYEGPSDLGGILSCTNAVLYSSDKTNVITNLPYSFNSSSEFIYFNSLIKNGMLSFDVRCGDYLLKTYDIKLVDTSLTNIFTNVGAEIQFPYYGSETTNLVQITGLGNGVFIPGFNCDGKWTVDVPNGIYKLRVFFSKAFCEGSSNLSKECLLVVGDVDFEKKNYGLKCGDKNPLNIHLFDGFNLPTNVVWRITPELNDGAYFRLVEDTQPVYESYATEGNINIYAGTATNQYTLSAWYEDVCIIKDNISVDVFPYEIAIDNTILSSNMIARSNQVHTKPFHVETTSLSTNHYWRLEGLDGSKEDSYIGGSSELMNADSIRSTSVYIQAGVCDQKYNLTAQHEIYENITDTVEIRICDIFFNPISCEMAQDGNIINPRSFVCGDTAYYKLIIEPQEFIEDLEPIQWNGGGIDVISGDESNLSVSFNVLNVQGEYDEKEVSIVIPNYFELPPKFKIRVYKEYKNIYLKPIVVKYSENQYVNYGVTNNVYHDVYMQQYNFSSRDDFYDVLNQKLEEYLEYANKIFKQIGVRFVYDNISEEVSPDVFTFHSQGDKNLIVDMSQNNPYNGIKLYFVDSFWVQQSKNVTTLAYTLNTSKIIYYGIVLQKKSNKECVPHEIGHAMGLSDIYLDSAHGYEITPEEEYMENDFTIGKNYTNQLWSEIIKFCLMSGVQYAPLDKYAKIIPIGNISGNVEKNSQKFPLSIPVGQENINRNPKTGVSIYE